MRFTLPGAGLVRVELFDVEGRAVGAHWGVYLIRLDAGQQRVTGKVVILK
ncbi:MAG: hypothetical protein NTW14_10985 [bacterium]|nr:hypothetical protein [bacterium]